MGIEVYLGMPPPNIVAWIRDHRGPVVKAETHIKFVDGTEEDYLLEGNVDYQYLVGKGLMQQAGGPPEWIKQPQEVDFGSAITGIGDLAFNNCADLTSVVIPNSVTSIGYDVFSGCIRLTSVTIPDSVTSIGGTAFYNNGLTSVTFSGKDKATVQGMSGYRWQLPSGCVLHCTDGDITI